jgi:AcrR family transcriptional regulator
MSARATDSATASRRAAGRERRHLRILAAAEQLFAEQGFAKTTVDEIAAAAGVSKGLVYQHYESKEALLLAIWLRLVEAWTAATQSAKLTGGSVADAIGEGMRLSFEHVRATPLLRRILAQDPGSILAGGPAGIAAFARTYRSGLEPVLEWGVRNGELRADLDVAHTAEVVWLLHYSLTRELCVGPRSAERTDADAFVRAAVALLVEGLREHGSRGPRPSR